MHIVPSQSPNLLSSVKFNVISQENKADLEDEACICFENHKNFKESPRDLLQIKIDHLRTILTDEELPYFFEDGTNIHISSFDPSVDANREYERFMNCINRKISCLNDQIHHLNVNALRMHNFSIVGLAISLPVTMVAFIIGAVAFKALSLSFTTLSAALFLTSYFQLYLKNRAESDLELLNLKKNNYLLLENAAFDSQQKKITQKILNSLLDCEAHLQNKPFASELNQLEDVGVVTDQSDMYLIEGKRAVLC